MNEDEVRARLDAGLHAFMETDRYLLEHDLNERCIAARVAFHLQGAFPDHIVDVEYNRAGDTPKRLHVPAQCANSFDESGRALVVPDIIIHRRGGEGPNLLGIELKKTTDRRGFECDRLRIRALRAELRYSYGALLICETRDDREPSIAVSEWL